MRLFKSTTLLTSGMEIRMDDMTNEFTIGDAEIIIKGKEKIIKIPGSEVSCLINVPTVDHFSSRGGLRVMERQMVTGSPEGEIKFTVLGELSFEEVSNWVEKADDKTISELLDLIIQKQQEADNGY